MREYFRCLREKGKKRVENLKPQFLNEKNNHQSSLPLLTVNLTGPEPSPLRTSSSSEFMRKRREKRKTEGKQMPRKRKTPLEGLRGKIPSDKILFSLIPNIISPFECDQKPYISIFFPHEKKDLSPP